MTVACMSSKLMIINKYKEPRTWLRCNSTTLLVFIFTINITEEQPFFLQISMNTKYVMSLHNREAFRLQLELRLLINWLSDVLNCPTGSKVTNHKILIAERPQQSKGETLGS